MSDVTLTLPRTADELAELRRKPLAELHALLADAERAKAQASQHVKRHRETLKTCIMVEAAADRSCEDIRDVLRVRMARRG